MQFAKSMYLGATVIKASECNYQSSANLGLRCVCCGESVFLRSGSIRTNRLRNGKLKEQIINPYFCHYKGGEFNDCEQRIYGKMHVERIRQIEIEGRNQRLKLYNKRLWEMFKSDRVIYGRSLLVEIKKILGKRKINDLATSYRQQLKKNKKDIQPYLEEILNQICDTEYHQNLLHEVEGFGLDISQTKINVNRTRNYFQHGCDRRLHLSILNEIADFLSTRTSGYFWQNLIPALACELALQMGETNHVRPNFYYKKAAEMICDETPKYALQVLAEVRWIEQINQALEINTEPSIEKAA